MPEKKAREVEPDWYENAVIYQLHVRALYDSDGDGIGDFRGLTEKLDYLQDLGVTTLWLLPFYPSPLRDDGYDIADYTRINPAYGTLRDFRRFLREAHKRDLKVVTELVLNHTSDQHAWFQRARKAKPGSTHRDFYVWSDTPDRYRDARIIFKDFEHSNWSWDPVAKAYYWHRFYHHQPDLNFENPAVHKALLKVLDHWLEMGVDGLRLDAVPYLYEEEGTTCENLPATHDFLKKLRAHVDEKYPGRMLLAEANQWPEDSVEYFGDGDECHMAFHFPVMPRLFMSVRMEDRFPIVDIMDQTPSIPEGCQWAIFLRNHDELTLEMVTDEERDYMYRAYAEDPRARINLGIRRRLAPLLGNDRRRIELLNALLFSLPGTPIIYYGDEIGMGDNFYLGDRHGVRTPMQWSPDRNAGFSRANPQKLYLPVIIDPEYHYESVNVESQQNNTHSLLWWMRRLIALRRRFQAFGRGEIEFLQPDNRKVLAFLRTYGDEQILVLANLSRFVQYVELDLSRFQGMEPVELFSRSAFPEITDEPYFMTLGPHGFYWFALEKESEQAAPEGGTMARRPVTVASRAGWGSALRGKSRGAVEKGLPGWLRTRRWFGSKSRKIRSASFRDVLTLKETKDAVLCLVDVRFTEGDDQTYLVPLTALEGAEAEELLRTHPEEALSLLRVKGTEENLVLCDATRKDAFAEALLASLGRRAKLRGERGEAKPRPKKRLRDLLSDEEVPLPAHVLKGEQSNTSIAYGETLIVKLIRKVEPGINPDLEIGRFLTERDFSHTPAVLGSLDYVEGKSEPRSLAVVQEYVPNEGDAWRYTLDGLRRYYDRMASRQEEERPAPPESHLLELAAKKMPDEVREVIGLTLQSAELLGIRTAELHLALASEEDDPDFAPEAMTALAKRSIYQSMRALTSRTLTTLRKQVETLPTEIRPSARHVLEAREEILARMKAVLELKIGARRIRNHGDYHLGQVLHTGKDFIIIDFEGEPARPLAERRFKRLALRDVAGMIRSYHYAAHAGLLELREQGMFRPEEAPERERWAELWYRWCAATFLAAYLERAEGSVFLPENEEETRVLLDALLLEKAVYEMGYEMDSRPGWLRIPVRGILDLLEDQP